MKRLILIIFILAGFSFKGVSIDSQNRIDKPINISYNDMMKYLKNFYKMKLSKINNTNRYLGTTKYSLFEMIGNKNNLTSTTFILFINPKDQKSTIQNSALLLRFLNNAAPEWEDSNTWAVNSLNKMTSGESEVEEETIGEKTIKMSYLKSSSSFLIVVKHKKE